MKYVGAFSAVALICALGIQQGRAQPAASGSNQVHAAGKSPALRPDQFPAERTNLAVEQRCPEMAVDVTAESDDERRVVCSAAAPAVQLLGRCGISLRRPVKVHVTSEVRHPLSGAVLGLLDTKQDRVLVTQEANVPPLVRDTPFAKLPVRDFYRSLIVHEVVHGIMHQNLKRPAATHAAYEYPAYALQIASLAPQLRDAFLRSFDQTAIRSSSSIFSDAILFFDPYFFAANAYEHFKASPDGCARLTALLEGEVAFIAPPQM
jgi:hypothetical protein